MAAKKIQPEDILDLADFLRQRRARQAEVIAVKRDRRWNVGPFVTFLFENYATMWWQVHEMLRVEKGGAAQVADELAAYNPLIPQGRELVATMQIEIEDPVQRAATLAKLGGIEDSVSLTVGDAVIKATANEDLERTNAAGKAAAVHFLRFTFTDAQARAFRDPKVPVVLRIEHPEYGHMAVAPAAVRRALAEDFAP
jgi:Protein of unknown function (DUF3501)